jgi:hypothetical protein
MRTMCLVFMVLEMFGFEYAGAGWRQLVEERVPAAVLACGRAATARRKIAPWA